MNVSEALERRISTRAFTDEPVPTEIILRALRMAGRAPSGANLQPWRVYVLNGEKMAAFKKVMAERALGRPDPPEYPVYPENLGEPYRTHLFQVGEDMYGLMDIRRDEKPKRWDWFRRNFQFFGAPAAVFLYVDRQLGAAQWADCGMFLQSLMLALCELGLETCPQEAWSHYPKAVGDLTGAPPELMLFCGLAIGHGDPDHPVNSLRARRMPLEDWVVET